MQRTLLLLVTFVCLTCEADTAEPPCMIPTTCCESYCNVFSENIVDKEEVRWIKVDVRELNKKIRNLEVLEATTKAHLKMIEKQIEDDGNDEWNIYMASWTLLGLIAAVAAIGVVFIVKENSTSKKAIELAEQEVELAKRKLTTNVDRAVNNFSKKAEIELSLFRARMQLLEIIITESELNNDDVYSAVSLLKEHSRPSFLSLYNRLKDLDLEDDVKNLIQEAINVIPNN